MLVLRRFLGNGWLASWGGCSGRGKGDLGPGLHRPTKNRPAQAGLCFEVLKMSHFGDVLLVISTLGVVKGGEHFFAAVLALTAMWAGTKAKKANGIAQAPETVAASEGEWIFI